MNHSWITIYFFEITDQIKLFGDPTFVEKGGVFSSISSSNDTFLV